MMQERQWAMICHLSGLAGYIIPFGNIIVPIIIWSAKKDEFPLVDLHGKEVINFQISISIWMILSAVLILVLLGVFFLAALAILQVAFVIIGALKADNGVLFRYPLTVRFIK